MRRGKYYSTCSNRARGRGREGPSGEKGVGEGSLEDAHFEIGPKEQMEISQGRGRDADMGERVQQVQRGCNKSK